MATYLFIYLFFIIGVCLLVSAPLTIMADAKMKANSNYTMGTIVSVERKMTSLSSEVDNSYTLVVSSEAEGKIYNDDLGFFTTRTNLIKNIGNVGDVVGVYYSKDNPSEFKVYNQTLTNTSTKIIIGLVFVIVGLVIINTFYKFYPTPKQFRKRKAKDLAQKQARRKQGQILAEKRAQQKVERLKKRN